jgi:hypothetical protein
MEVWLYESQSLGAVMAFFSTRIFICSDTPSLEIIRKYHGICYIYLLPSAHLVSLRVYYVCRKERQDYYSCAVLV